MKTENHNRIISILIVALLVAVTVACITAKQWLVQKRSAEDWKGKYTYATQTIDSITNKYDQIVYEQKVAITNNQEELKRLSSEIFNLNKREEKYIKQVDALIRIAQQVRLDTVEFYYTEYDTIPAKDTTNYDNWVHVPKTIVHKSDSLELSATVLKNSLRINSMVVPDTVNIRLAEQKKGLFAPREQVIQVLHSNPLYENRGMQSYRLKEKPSLWNRVIKPTLFATAGLLIGSALR